MQPSPKSVVHRPWPLPAGPWIMAQKWHDLLFAHWAVPASALRKVVPAQLELDCFEGQCWLGIVPFRMSGVRLRGTPALPGLSAFPEVNVRTYVTAEHKPGVWFFSLDAANRIAVELARAWFHLPYFMSQMACAEVENEIRYRSRRTDRRGDNERLECEYAARGQAHHAEKGTLEYFLTERYCLYAQRKNGEVLRSEIHHAPWCLQNARANFGVNTMVKRLGLSLDGPPLVHFSQLQDVIVWRPKLLTK